MSLSALESTVNSAFDARDGISTATKGEVREAVDHALELLDKGEARVAERAADGKWKVNQWLKKAVLLSFRLNDMSAIAGGPGQASWWDKVPSKFDGWGENRFRDAGFRAVPGGTAVDDEVEFSVPGGRIIERLFVRRDVRAIFKHRQQAILDVFDAPAPPSFAIHLS